MTKHVVLMTVLIGMCINGYGAGDATVFANYQNIVQSETNAPAAMKKGKQYLVSLNHNDFMAFIREAGRDAGFARDDSDIVLVMAIFAKCYKDGPGKNEPLLLTLKQVSDATLPTSWKIALLDMLKPENRPDLTEEEIAAVIAALDGSGQDKKNSDVFRFFCLQRLGSLLYTQREIITQRAPDLKDSIEKQDRSALPKRDDANVRQAVKLIDAIQDYKAALQKTADEVKDKKIKADLKNYLMKWQPASVTPTK